MTIEQLEQYKQTEIELAKVCLEWAKQNLDNSWQYYAGWEINEDNSISVYYTYNGIINNIEFEDCHDTKCVSWQDMVEFSKTLKL